MSIYRLPWGTSRPQHPHPERTSWKVVGLDCVYKIWSCREAMARCIRVQQRRERKPGDWEALLPLQDGEGYGGY